MAQQSRNYSFDVLYHAQVTPDRHRPPIQVQTIPMYNLTRINCNTPSVTGCQNSRYLMASLAACIYTCKAAGLLLHYGPETLKRDSVIYSDHCTHINCRWQNRYWYSV